MKNILPVLALACLTATAQTPPPPASSKMTTPPGVTNGSQRAPLPRVSSRTNAAAQMPAFPSAPAPRAGAQQNPPAAAPRAYAPAVNPPPVIQTPSGETIMIQPPAGATNAPQEEMIPPGMIDFRGTDVNEVLRIYAELVNRTVLRPATLAAQGQIVLRTQTPLTKREAIQALEAVLAINGIALINAGDKFVKAVPLAQAGQAGGEFSKDKPDQMPDIGSYVTHVVQLQYVKPSEMMQVLQPFASAIPNPILPIDASQILVLRDYTENVKRMLEMIKKVDVIVPSEFVSEVIMIKYAQATEIANVLSSLSSGGGATSIGGSSGGSSSSRGVSRGIGGMSGGMGGMGNRLGTGSTGYGGYQSGTMGNTPFGSTTQAGGATGSSFTDRVRSLISKASGSGEITVLGNTKMIADERTNSLLVYASREDMKTIKGIVEKLDVVLAQVLIEAVIIEVTLGDTKETGFSYLQRPQTSGNFGGVGAINNTGGFKSATDFISGSTNALSGGFSYLAKYSDDFDVMIKAVANNNKARIVQRPRVQTSHNEPASLFVGESRPYPTGTFYGGAYGGSSSIQQVPIGVTLTVTPLINPDGLVVMEISQDIQSVSGSVNIANVGDVPITSQKSAQAKVSVRDRDTIILGGLIENSKSRSRSGVPLLMNIPVLGYLFSANTGRDQRNEMIVMIRPTVLPTPEIAAVTARAERDSMPLIKSAESEAAADEARQLRKVNKFDERIKAGDKK